MITKTAITILAASLAATLAIQVTAMAEGECRQDRQKFCNNETRANIGACLDQHTDELSEACKAMREARALASPASADTSPSLRTRRPRVIYRRLNPSLAKSPNSPKSTEAAKQPNPSEAASRPKSDGPAAQTGSTPEAAKSAASPEPAQSGSQISDQCRQVSSADDGVGRWYREIFLAGLNR